MAFIPLSHTADLADLEVTDSTPVKHIMVGPLKQPRLTPEASMTSTDRVHRSGILSRNKRGRESFLDRGAAALLEAPTCRAVPDWLLEPSPTMS